MHPAVGGESGPFIDPQTETREADPKRPLWAAPLPGTVGRERTRSSLLTKTPMQSSYANKAKGIWGTW